MSYTGSDSSGSDNVQQLVDCSIPIRKYFAGTDDKDINKLVHVYCRDLRNVDKVYAATVVTQFLLQSNRFKISCSANGDIHVCVEELRDAEILDYQVFKAFGGEIEYWRDGFVAEEPRSTHRVHQKSFAFLCKP